MVTLVTACMNREAHLRQSLPRWLVLPQLAELIVVDWSNSHSLGDLRSIDPRVKVVRIEGESKWILSYAYNVGISRATHPVIVKCDADCMPLPETMQRLPGPAYFHAGYWRTGATVGKPSVNGQCVFLKSQFDAVNGYSELIRTYGRDDEDFYDRLKASGFERREIPPACLDFIGHSNDERTVNQFADNGSISPEQRVFRNTLYNEMHNYFVGKMMPWDNRSRRAVFQESHGEERFSVLRRDQAQEIPIPGEVEAAARLLALRYVSKRVAGISDESAGKLDARGCLALIIPRLYGGPQKIAGMVPSQTPPLRPAGQTQRRAD